jgi:hypothetical protein
MHEDVPIEDLEVIGTTTVPEDLPRRLSPVYRRRGDLDYCYFTVDEDREGPPFLSREERAYFEELVERGDAARFEHAIAARLDHRLVQLDPGALPEYFPAADLPIRLTRACREALERASRALVAERREEAERLAWYARRASEDDPLPLLLLIALLRGVLPAEQMQFLERDLAEYSPAHIEHARRRARTQAELSALGELLDQAPRSGVCATYISGYPSKPGFLDNARKLVAEAGRPRSAAPRSAAPRSAAPRSAA